MAHTCFKGTRVSTSGDLPHVGKKAPDFSLLSSSLEHVGRDALTKQFPEKAKILNVVPSFDTRVCAESARAFEALHVQAIVVGISRDTPFAQSRFCTAEGMSESIFLSDIDRRFGISYGVEMIDGPLAFFLARAVFVLDEKNVIVYANLVPEITQEPNYDAVRTALESLSAS